MSMNPTDPGCQATQDDLAELALGTLSGLERSVVLAHVQGCSRCRDEVDRLSAVADAILTLAPEVEPQAGFETRLFERMGVTRPRRWHRPKRRVQRIALAGSALLGGLGIGLGLAFTSGGGSAIATSTPIVANLTAENAPRGEVYVAPGHPSWLFMSVADAKVTGLVSCRITTVAGRTMTIGTFWLASGSGTWAYELEVPAEQVKRAWVVTGDGTVLASATLTR